MSDWSHGYNVSLGYTYGFYRELAPEWLDLCARLAGYMPPSRGVDGSFRYLELGSGQGVGLCLLAAANPDGEFVGIDFNPEHIAHSNGLAISAGLTNVRFIEGDFAELGANWPAELGQFDYAVLHGIYSWIPVTVRQALVQCLAHACPPGGLVYNSYNTKPGWVSTMPFQHMARRLQVVGALPGPKAIDDAVKLFESLGDENGTLFRVLPTLKARLNSVKTQNRAYLVQEYLHENWHPLWFSEVAQEFGAAKLNYIGSATLPEQMLPGLLPQPARDVVAAQTDPIFRQEVQDCAINQSFRRDVYCRGARLAFTRGVEAAMGTVLRLINAPSGDSLKLSTSFGEITIQRENFGPALAALEDGPKTIAQLTALPKLASLGAANVIQNLLLLVHSGAIAVARAQAPDPAPAQRFNAAVAKAVSEGAPYTHFAAPALGSALPASDIDCMLLDTWLTTPNCTPEQLGQGLRARLQRVNRSLSHDGKALQGEALDKRVESLSRDFASTAVPRWRGLGAII